ncbi:MAG: hypothetical protein E6G97_25935 [Alphaproteobacteria bacterium]|nr:MAG: hypothetical protein E6G97_25935 [Alphaproteobacteria bacterium]
MRTFEIDQPVRSAFEGGLAGKVVEIHGDQITVEWGAGRDAMRSTFPAANLRPVDTQENLA